MIEQVISGGQTGADIAGLEVAAAFGLKTGGTMPFGFRTLDGCKPEYAEMYGITAHRSSSYVPRTKENVKNSDGTIRLAFDFESRGEICTLNAIERYGKTHFDVHLENPEDHQDVIDWLEKNEIRILNVAGNAEQTAAGTHDKATKYLTELFLRLGFERAN